MAEDPPGGDGPKIVHLAEVRDVLDAAQEVAREWPEAPEHLRRLAPTLPDDCPVIPLGRGPKGRDYYFLAPDGTVMELNDNELSRQSCLAGLFAPMTFWLFEHFPRITADQRIDNFRAELVGRALVDAAARRGFWQPDSVRGRGWWSDDDQNLILHSGEVLHVVPRYTRAGTPAKGWSARVRRPLGELGEHVYPRAALCPLPADRRNPAAIAEIMADLDTWHWASPEAPRLLLGWMAAAILGGALDWRPLVWIVGGHGRGKSSLRTYIRGILDACLSTSDGSKAWVTQTLRQASLPVMFDDLEQGDGMDDRLDQVLALARLAAGGDTGGRGSPGGETTTFTLRSAFFFSSTVLPSVPPAFYSRLILLKIEPLDTRPGGRQQLPDLRGSRLKELGRQLRRALVDGWPILPEILAPYREAVRAAGHLPRGVDVYGTTLALADLAFGVGEPDRDTLRERAAAVAPVNLVDWREGAGEAEACLSHLLGQMIRLEWDGKVIERTVAELCRQAAGWTAKADLLDNVLADVANTALARHGLRVSIEPLPPDDRGRPVELAWLIISRGHVGVARLLRGTQWEGRSGRSRVYLQALEEVARLTGGVVCSDRVKSVGGSKSRTIELRLELFVDRAETAAADGVMPSAADEVATGPGG